MRSKRNKKGFTLIEIMVVIAIVGILASIVLVNTGKNSDRDVRQEADRLAVFLRDVQNMALTAEQIAASQKVCGVGVHLEEPTGNPMYLQPFYVYASAVAPDNKLDVNCSDDSKVARTEDNQIGGSDATNSLTQTFGDKFYLRSGVEFDTDSSHSDIFFLIPHGEIYYAGSSIDDKDSPNVLPDKAELTIEKESTPLTVIVNGAGKISY